MTNMEVFSKDNGRTIIKVFEDNYKKDSDMKIDYERKHTSVKAIQLKELNGENILKCMMFCGNAKPLNSFDEMHFDDYVDIVNREGYLNLVIGGMSLKMNVGDYLVWDRVKYKILTKEQFEMSFIMEKDIKEIMSIMKLPINIGIENAIDNYKNGETELSLNDIYLAMKYSLDMRYLNSDEYYRFCDMLLNANL